jgi:hypothetical protein
MTKEQELIDELNTEDSFATLIYAHEVEVIVGALEKQVPKELHIYANGTEHCPSCDANLTGMGFKYCVECGQALLD